MKARHFNEISVSHSILNFSTLDIKKNIFPRLGNLPHSLKKSFVNIYPILCRRLKERNGIFLKKIRENSQKILLLLQRSRKKVSSTERSSVRSDLFPTITIGTSFASFTRKQLSRILKISNTEDFESME